MSSTVDIYGNIGSLLIYHCGRWGVIDGISRRFARGLRGVEYQTAGPVPLRQSRLWVLVAGAAVAAPSAFCLCIIQFLSFFVGPVAVPDRLLFCLVLVISGAGVVPARGGSGSAVPAASSGRCFPPAPVPSAGHYHFYHSYGVNLIYLGRKRPLIPAFEAF